MVSLRNKFSEFICLLITTSNIANYRQRQIQAIQQLLQMNKVSPSQNYNYKVKNVYQALKQYKTLKDSSPLKPFSSLSLSSQMVFVKIDPLRNDRSLEKTSKKEKPVVYDLLSSEQHPQEKVSLKPSYSPAKKMAVLQKKKKQPLVTLHNFEGHLREIWGKNPGIDFEQFYKISKKYSAFIEPSHRQYVNLNRRWCLHFFKKMKQNRFKYDDPNYLPKDPEPKQSSDSFYQMFSEPQSAQMERNVSNSSQIWKKHTLKILQEKYTDQKPKYQSQNEKSELGLIIINQKMKKTLENRKDQLARLQHDFFGQAVAPKKNEKAKEKVQKTQKNDIWDCYVKKIPKKKEIYTFEQLKKEEMAISHLASKQMKLSMMKKVELLEEGEIKQQMN